MTANEASEWVAVGIMVLVGLCLAVFLVGLFTGQLELRGTRVTITYPAAPACR